jgi:hypothetical protein
MNEKMTKTWDIMVEMNIATDEELGLAVALCGRTEETLNQVLYIRTGYRTLEQMIEEEFEDWE